MIIILIGVVCDNCNVNPMTGYSHSSSLIEPIIKRYVGVRYKCSTCPDYDLCAYCVELNDTEHFHDRHHIFYRLPKPITVVEC